MFCTKCGAEIQPPAKFCPKCGTPIDGAAAPNPAPAQNPAPNPVYTAPVQNPAQNSTYAAPVQNPAPNPVYAAPAQNPVPNPVYAAHGTARKGKVQYGANTLVGVIGAFAVFIGMFLDFLTASAAGILSESISFVSLMAEGEASFVSMIVFVCIAWVVLFHLLKCPKVSLVGVLGMIFGIVITMWAFEETKPNFGGLVKFSYGIGFWLYVGGLLACIVAAFIKKKRA